MYHTHSICCDLRIIYDKQNLISHTQSCGLIVAELFLLVLGLSSTQPVPSSNNMRVTPIPYFLDTGNILYTWRDAPPEGLSVVYSQSKYKSYILCVWICIRF